MWRCSTRYDVEPIAGVARTAATFVADRWMPPSLHPAGGVWVIVVACAVCAAAAAADIAPFALAMVATALAAVAGAVCHGQARTIAAARSLEPRLHSQVAMVQVQLVALRAILDDMDYGIVVLDQDQRVQFINATFRDIWRLPGTKTDSRETFVRLMYRGPSKPPYAVTPDQLGGYVAEQLRLIRTGDDRPVDVRLANGDVFRCRCKILPSDGRLLTYDNVSNLVHHADTLERLAAIDAMTGLNNRRQFLALAEKEWIRFRRYGRPLSLLMIDIDLFKSVNDTYGHDVGDKVIKTVAEHLEISKRASDIAGRLGGEEFALMLPEAALDNACAAAERLRQLIATCAVAVEGQSLSVTISIGASSACSATRGMEELMKQADMALYEAKRSGRDRVCRFTG